MSLRKAATFGLSFGLTLPSVAWATSYLRLPARGLVLGVFIATCVVETVLISMQAWRGVPSHFNFATPFDTAVSTTLALGGGVIVLVGDRLHARGVRGRGRARAEHGVGGAHRVGRAARRVRHGCGDGRARGRRGARRAAASSPTTPPGRSSRCTPSRCTWCWSCPRSRGCWPTPRGRRRGGCGSCGWRSSPTPSSRRWSATRRSRAYRRSPRRLVLGVLSVAALVVLATTGATALRAVLAPA